MIHRVPASLCLTLLTSAIVAGAAFRAAADDTSYAPVAITESFGDTLKRMRSEKPKVMKRQQDLLAERYDLADRPGGRASRCRAASRCRRACASSFQRARPGTELAAMSPEEIQAQGPLARGLLPAAAPESRRGRHDLPEVPDRRDQEAGRPRPDALRSRLRPARPLPARVPGADLPDDAARSRRRLARASSSRSTTSTSCSTASSIRSSSKACGCWSRRSRSSSSTRPTIAAARSRATASPASTATPTATPTPRRTWSATSGRTSIPPPHRHADAARREHPAAVRLAARAEDASRTSPSSSSAPPTSTATP